MKVDTVASFVVLFELVPPPKGKNDILLQMDWIGVNFVLQDASWTQLDESGVIVERRFGQSWV